MQASDSARKMSQSQLKRLVDSIGDLDTALTDTKAMCPPPLPPPLPSQQQQHLQDSQPIETNSQPKKRETKSSTSSDIQCTTCMELALEGERLCKTGDLKNGVSFFEEALKVGTSNDRTLSAIYSQLGNAYFYLEDYQKALDYHKKDVNLVHSIDDKAAEAKACGNLGNTYKMLGKYDEAAVYCKRYLGISRKLHDNVGEARALYNLGNVYHMQGKRMIGTSEQETGELPSDIQSSLERAIEYYEANLKVVSSLSDRVGMGRAYGNLGNTHYLLGNFQLAVENHEQRLKLAKLINDKSAERRAHLNLGNANVFLGNFTEAIKNYTATLKLAQELNDKLTEAQACQSLANTYTFLRDYQSAISYHLKYFDVIKESDDKLGEGRACWSLVNIYHIIKDPESALVYARRHHELAKQLGDETGLACAKANIEELEDTLAQRQALQTCTAAASSSFVSSTTATTAEDGTSQHNTHGHNNPTSALRNNLVRLSSDKRQEQEQRRFKKQLTANLAPDIDGLAAARRRCRGGLVRSSSSERFFDLIAQSQSGRIDDQRCEMRALPSIMPASTDCRLRAPGYKVKDTVGSNSIQVNPSSELASTINNNDSNNSSKNGTASSTPRTSQPSITNPISAVSAAASKIKATYRKASLVAYPSNANSSSIQSQRRPTVSVEHREQLFDLIAGAQNQRMDEQRASLPTLAMANGVIRNSMNIT